MPYKGRYPAGSLVYNGIWYYGTAEGAAAVETMSAGNLKQVWTNGGRLIDWSDDAAARGCDFMERATQVKTIWVPYGA